jgi:hypothetical protein
MSCAALGEESPDERADSDVVDVVFESALDEVLD